MDSLQLIQSIALIMILASHYLLIRGCFGIREQIPVQGGEITTHMQGISELLDELAQLMSDMLDSQPKTGSKAPENSMIGLLVNSLISKSSMNQDYATPYEVGSIRQEGEHSQTPNQAENQSDQLSD